MEQDTQRAKKNQSLWFYVGPVVLGLAAGIALLLVEYSVFDPGNETAQLERAERLRLFGIWCGGIVLAIVLLTSLVRRDGRAWWLSIGRWLRGLRPQFPISTAKQRTANAQRLYREGFDARSEEVTREKLKPTSDLRLGASREGMNTAPMNSASITQDGR